MLKHYKIQKVKISLIQIFLYLPNILLFPVHSYSLCLHHKVWRSSKKMDAKSISWKVICTCTGSYSHHPLWFPSLDMLQLRRRWFSRLVLSDSCNPMAAACQTSLSIGFSRQEMSGLPFPFPGDLPDPGIKPASPVLASGFFTTELSG